MRHAAVAARDGRVTASWGFTQQCGSESSSSKDGGSPSKTNRLTPARAADAAPGAVDPSRSTSATDAPASLPARRGSWPFPYRIDKHAVVDVLGGRPDATPAPAARRGPPGARPIVFRLRIEPPAHARIRGQRQTEPAPGREPTPAIGGEGAGPSSATAPYRPTPTAAGCMTSPWRRTRWPRPVSRRSPPGGTAPWPRSAAGWSGGANPVVAQSVRRRTRPSRSSGPGAGRTGRCAGRRPRPGRG